jgi:hypothetical protein
MLTLKESVVAICTDVAKEFAGWEFKGGEFKKSILKHCDAVISAGFHYDAVSTCLLPSVQIDHKPSRRLCESIIGYDYGASLLRFDEVKDFFGKCFKENWNNSTIVKNKKQLFHAVPDARRREDCYIDIFEVPLVMRAMVQDGIALLDRYYDQTSEDSLLRGLPPRYEPRFKHDDPPGLNGTAGIAACIAHIYVGDFEFFEWYRSEACKTVLPKKEADLKKIELRLLELKEKFGRRSS